MSFNTYFRMTSYGLVATSFGALVATGDLDALPVSLFLVAWVACLVIDVRGYKRLHLREWMWRTLAVAYVPFVLLDATIVSKNRVLALVHMTLFLSAVKLAQDKRERDWVFLYLIGFFQMLLAAGLTFNATFVASLTIYVFFLVSTLAALEIRRAQRLVPKSNEETVSRFRQATTGAHKKVPSKETVRSSKEGGTKRVKPVSRVRYLFGAALAELCLVAFFAFPLFFLIPRSSANGTARGLGNFETLTGFSDKVSLGDMASIKQSSRVVMHVKLDRDPGKWLRWRGIALDHYDGRSWSFSRPRGRETLEGNNRHTAGEDWGDSSFVPQYKINTADPYSFSMDQTGAPVQPPQPRNLIRQDIVLEPWTGSTLFAARKLLRLRGPIRQLKVQDTGAVAAMHLSRISYTAWSDAGLPGESELRVENSGVYPKKIEELYLQLPNPREDGMRMDPRVTQLAHEITRGYSSSYDKARAVESYFKKNFSYTLNVEASTGDPLAEFLFDTRSGYCQYFATAMTILLRTVGIPARVVNGFQMGEYNELNHEYAVRERDAHSWVEVYLAATNTWVEFDPTPAAGINDYAQGGWVAQLRKLMDATEVFWMDYVVTLDRDQQASIMLSLQHALMQLRDSLISWYQSSKLWTMNEVGSLILHRRWGSWQIVQLAAVLALLFVFFVSLHVLRSYLKLRSSTPTGYGPWWKRLFILPTWRGGRRLKRDEKVSAVLFYEQMLSILSRRGIIKSPDQTPLEFAAHQTNPQVRQITDVYNRVRFGRGRLGEEDKEFIARKLSELRQSIRQGRRGWRGRRTAFH